MAPLLPWRGDRRGPDRECRWVYAWRPGPGYVRWLHRARAGFRQLPRQALLAVRRVRRRYLCAARPPRCRAWSQSMTRRSAHRHTSAARERGTGRSTPIWLICAPHPSRPNTQRAAPNRRSGVTMCSR